VNSTNAIDVSGNNRQTRRIALAYRPIAALKLDPRNPRAHSPRQVRQIARSIESFGFNVFTDPPYNVRIDGNVSGLGAIHHREFAMGSGELSEAEFTAFLSRTCSLLVRHTAEGSPHFICMDWRHMGELLAAGREAYTELKNLCVWTKDNGGMGSSIPRRSSDSTKLSQAVPAAPRRGSHSRSGLNGRHVVPPGCCGCTFSLVGSNPIFLLMTTLQVFVLNGPIKID
jgi:hypothetical protein